MHGRALILYDSLTVAVPISLSVFSPKTTRPFFFIQINNVTGCGDWITSTMAPVPRGGDYFGYSVSMATSGLVVVGAFNLDSSFLYAINATSPTEAFVFLAELLPAPGGPGRTNANYGMNVVGFVDASFDVCVSNGRMMITCLTLDRSKQAMRQRSPPRDWCWLAPRTPTLATLRKPAPFMSFLQTSPPGPWRRWTHR